jgi:alpha-tubulin suppressor-like RCC1 family protein
MTGFARYRRLIPGFFLSLLLIFATSACYFSVSTEQLHSESPPAETPIDNEAPTIISVTTNIADGQYTTGTTLNFQVTFSKIVIVSAKEGSAIELTLSLNTTPNFRYATYVSGTGTNILTFTYTVTDGDNSLLLDYSSANALILGANTSLQDNSGHDANLILPTPGQGGSLSSNKNIAIITNNLATPSSTPIAVTGSNPSPTPSPSATPTVTALITSPIIILLGSANSDRTFSPTLSFASGIAINNSAVVDQIQIRRYTDDIVIYDWHSFTTGSSVSGLNLDFNTPYYFRLRSSSASLNLTSTEKFSAIWTLTMPSPPDISALGGFIWMAGSQDIDTAGTYGIITTGSITNNPGARDSAMSWIDSNGNYWIFGGEGFDSTGTWGNLNDLWKFDINSKWWIWMGGSDEVEPPAHYGTLYTEDSQNIPGGRQIAGATWTDSHGNFWLFGGYGYDSDGTFSYLNDLWKYSPSSGNWTWMGGSNLADDAGSFSTQGDSSTSNMPSSRYLAANWVDNEGNFWLFGGYGYDSEGSEMELNDLWKYNPSSKKWTWVSGPSIGDTGAVYGDLGVSSATFIPKSNESTVGWADKTGKFWLWEADTNNLWKFDPTTSQWAIISGSGNLNVTAGSWGTMGITDPTNQPSARAIAAAWLDKQGNFYIFGGSGFDSFDNWAHLRDLWMFNPTTSNWTWVAGSNIGDESATFGTLRVADLNNWPAGFCTDGCSPAIATNKDGQMWLSGGYGNALGGRSNALWTYIPPNTHTTPFIAGSNNVEIGDTTIYSGFNGTAPYKFSIYYGDGFIDEDTGEFLAPANPGFVILQVTDALGHVGRVTVVIWTTPNTLSAISLAGSGNSPSWNNPVIHIDGVQPSITVYLSTDANCETTIGTTTAYTTSVDISPNTSLPTSGTYNFYVRQSDAFGHTSGCSSVSVNYQFIAPTIVIESTYTDPDNHTHFTSDSTPNLSLSANWGNPTEMKISNDDNCSSGNWEPFVNTKNQWSLSAGDGKKSVSVQMRNALQDVSACITDYITIDTTTPTAPTEISFINYSGTTKSPAISFTAATDAGGVSHYEVRIFKNSNHSQVYDWRNIGPSSPGVAIGLSLSNLETYTLELRAVDKVNNVSSAANTNLTWTSYTTLALGLGFNRYGQLGLGPDNPNNTISSPELSIAKVYGDHLFTKITNGVSFTCGLTVSGTAYCWGLNETGQLGNNSNLNSVIPVPVSGMYTFTQISAGDYQTCGITVGGTAYCWGANYNGQLGNANTISSNIPVAVSGNLSFSKISVGQFHTCGITTTGAAYCWGLNSSGQFGNGTTTNSTTPTAVSGNYTFTQISAGNANTCGIVTGGATYCWGDNSYGILGNGTYIDSTTPTTVDGNYNFSQIEVAPSYVCAITTDNIGYCWGTNGSGELGDGTNINKTSPAAITGSYTFKQISVGISHTCGLTTDDITYCWGENIYGELGNGTNSNSNVPILVSGNYIFTQISVGGYGSCGIANSGITKCWGSNNYGEIGNNGSTTVISPIAIPNNYAFMQISTGQDYTCGISASNIAYCWGYNAFGQLGNGTTQNSISPVAVSGTLAFTQVAASQIHTCGITTNGAAYCWGNNESYQLGDETTTNSFTPVAVNGNHTFTKVVVGKRHGCGLTTDSLVYCWGNNTFGSLGDSTNDDSGLPVLTSGTYLYTQIIAGDFHSCGITNAGRANCWGHNDNGQLGNGTNTNNNLPTEISGNLIFTQIAGGNFHTCGITNTGAAYCWGFNAYGQLGDSTNIDSTTPVAVSGNNTFRQISTGAWYTCALTTTDAVYCWGDNSNGQFGNNSTTPSNSPVAIGTSFTNISTGMYHTIGQISDSDFFFIGNYELQPGATLNTSVHGGSGQLHYTVISGDGTIDPDTGVVTAPNSSGTMLIQVTDSAGHIATVNVSVWVPPAVPSSLTRIIPISSPASINTITINVDGISAGNTVNLYSNNACTDFLTTSQVTGSSVDININLVSSGSYTFYAKQIEPQGHASVCSSASASYQLIMPTLNIAAMYTDGSNNRFTPVTTPTLTITASGNPSEMKLSNNSTCTGGTWEPFATSKNNWNITSGVSASDGLKTVSIQVREGTSSTSNCIIATINLDSTAPTNPTGINFANNSGITKTPSVNFTGSTDAGSGLNHYELRILLASNHAIIIHDWSNAGLTNPTSISGLSLTDLEHYTLELRALDNLGNASTGATSNLTWIANANLTLAFGSNRFGQLGTGPTDSHSAVFSPTQSAAIVTGGHQFIQVASGARFSCGLTSSGTAYCWGTNTYGQLGNNSYTNNYSPTAVSGGHVFTKISAGASHVCGLDLTGSIYCWGYNIFGQLGNGTTSNNNIPIPISSIYTFSQISAGGSHTCGIVSSSGAAYCWGYNGWGQLGDSTNNQSNIPIAVSGNNIFIQISTGEAHSCAITSSAEAYCWGYNYFGGLGDGTNTNRNAPVPVSGNLEFTKISAGSNHTCGILISSGAAYCWGLNGVGSSALGDGTNNNSNSPVAVTGSDSYSQIIASQDFTCGISTSNEAYCWGNNAYSQLGNETSIESNIPVITSGSYEFAQISTGMFHTCGITTSGSSYCWGSNSYGQIGNGGISNTSTPNAVVDNYSFSQISTNVYHACGLTTAGKAYCWGTNTYGQLGNGTNFNNNSPVAVSGNYTFSQIAVGIHHTCGILSSTGVAYCWGYNNFGQLGSLASTDSNVPVAVSGGHTFFNITAGAFRTCAISTTANQGYCWGYNGNGSLGNGTNFNSSSPSPVSGSLAFLQILTGDANTCGITNSNEVYCWGSNDSGQLGNGTTSPSNIPVAVNGSLLFSKISIGVYFVCGITTSDLAYCWGNNYYGQLGDGTTSNRSSPIAVDGSYNFSDISASQSHSCGITTNGSVYCWGDNSSGQFGMGNETSSLVPISIDASYSNLVTGPFYSIGVIQDSDFFFTGSNQVEGGTNLNTTVSGGTGTLHYTVTSGSGSIDYNTGVITAPNSSGPIVIQVTDANGNTATRRIDVWVPPSIPTSVTRTIPSVSPASNSNIVISVGGVDIGNIIKLFSDSSCTILLSSGQATGATIDLNLSLTDSGTYTFYATQVEPQGHISACSTAMATYQFVKPNFSIASSFTDGSNNRYTSVTTPTLTVTAATTTTEMKLSNNGSCSGGSWITFSSSIITWDITSGVSTSDGLKNVSLQMRAGTDTPSDCITSSITLDRTAPTTPTGLNYINLGGITKTPSISFTPSTDAGSGLKQYQIRVLLASNQSVIYDWRNAGTTNPASATGLNLTDGEVYALELRAVDNVANSSIVSTSTLSWTANANLVVGFGNNDQGQLGLGPNDPHNSVYSPAQSNSMVTGNHNFVQISAGISSSCGLTPSGIVYCWGDNTYGQLGNDTNINSATPVIVSSGSFIFSSISTGENFVCGLTTAGAAYCWGYNIWGTLGNGSNSNSKIPVAVSGNFVFSKISAGRYSTCAITSTGSTYCWGNNTYGQLGDNTNTNSNSPQLVAGNYSFVQISVGLFSACGIINSGEAYCWGRNDTSQLGDTTQSNRNSPVLVSGNHLFSKISISTGHACGLTIDNLVYCWGNNNIGQLGNSGLSQESNTPVAINSGDSFTQITLGAWHACAITTTFHTYCWGFNANWQLGDGTDFYRTSPVLVSGNQTFAQLSAGSDHTCAINDLGAAFCWGYNRNGQIGNGSFTNSADPLVISENLAFTQLTASSKNSCATSVTGTNYCWGNNTDGQLGNGTNTLTYSPIEVTGGSYSQISTGVNHTCALNSSGAAYCWGSNFNGQLGDGTNTTSNIPVIVSGGLVFTQVSTGDLHTCGLTNSGSVYCWGQNGYGQIGDGSNTNRNAPVVIGGGHLFAQITTGQLSTCGLTTSGIVYCWGYNGNGQLGNSTYADSNYPVAVSGSEFFVKIATGQGHTCAINTTGTAYCWGNNFAGQLGIGNTTANNSPTEVSGNYLFTNIVAGNSHSCGLTTSGVTYCWGHNVYGQLGNSNYTNANIPVAIDYSFSNVFAGGEQTFGIINDSNFFFVGENSVEAGSTLNTSVSGGTGTLHYTVSSGSGSIDYNTGVITAPNNSGSMVIQVIDSNGNTATRKINIWQQPLAPNSVTRTSPSVSPGSTGEVTINVGGVTSGNTIKLYADNTCTTLINSVQASSSSININLNIISAGTYSIYATQTEPLGHTSSCSSASASYQFVKPTLTITSVYTDNVGNKFTSSTTPTLTISAPAGTTEMKLTNNNNCSGGSWETYVTSKSSWDITSGVSASDGEKTVSLQVRTGTSTPSACLTTSITLDTMAPSNPTGLNFVNISRVTSTPSISFTGGTDSGSGIDHYEVRIFLAADHSVVYSWLNAGSTNPTIASGLSLTDLESYTLELRAKDNLGNISNIATTSLTWTAHANLTLAFGFNDLGQLGLEPNDPHSPVNSPAQSSSLVTSGTIFTKIAPGYDFTCGLTATGSAYCWGYNYYGQLGKGTSGNSSSPTPVNGSYTFTQISTGENHACAITTSGAAYCWGYGGYGQLGRGSNIGSYSPVAVNGGYTFTQISAGRYHTCAVTTSGVGYCWGYNDNGQIGDGSYTLSNSPVPVSGNYTFSQINTSRWHTCGLTTVGTALCWGTNVRNGTNATSNIPIEVAGNYTFSQITVGLDHSCGLTSAGLAYCWGYNSSGQFGDGSNTGSNSPVQVSGGLTLFQISANEYHTCGITTSNVVYCWGANSYGQLGNGTVNNSNTPTTIAGGYTFSQINTGQKHNCGITTTGETRCWGGNYYGQIGNGASASVSSPIATNSNYTFSQIAAGNQHSCGLTSSGTAYCWGGYNYWGELGNGTNTSSYVPVAVSGSHTFAQINVGFGFSCGITTTGIAYCWGSNGTGNLGNNSSSPSNVPVVVSGGLTFSKISVGQYHTCGITISGSAYCWGSNEKGILGEGTTTNSSIPVAVAGNYTFVEISAGVFHTCAITTSGAAYCWGYNSYDQIGDGTNTETHIPVAVIGNHTFTQIAAGGDHTCAITSTGAAYCWGFNGNGQIGNGQYSNAGSIPNSTVPTAVSGNFIFSKIVTGSDHTCAITSTGVAYCWGLGNYGQIGNGTSGPASRTNTPFYLGYSFSKIFAAINETFGIF